ncbi:MAG: hypothetical protein AB9844_09645 [Clostridiaceae bacterium]
MFKKLKKIILDKPLATEEMSPEKLSIFSGLPDTMCCHQNHKLCKMSFQ